MLYIKNTLGYAVAFKLLEENGVERTFAFDCFRQYSDTGNVATTGVTEIAEADYERLYRIKQFKDFCDTGKLVKTTADATQSLTVKMDRLEEENAKLRAELAQKTKEVSVDNSVQLKEKDDEINSLKKQIEALSKKKGKEDKSEAKADVKDF